MFTLPTEFLDNSPLPPWAYPVGLAVVLYGARKLWTMGSRERGLPPGPPTLPIVGNLNILPREYLHLTFTEWAKQYGDAFSLKVMNQTLIILNTPTMMKEIIEKRGASSSNRPKSILADMITPKNMNMGTGRFANNTWKVLRKATTQLLNNENLKKLQTFQHAEAAQLMWDISHDPDNWYTHIQRYTTSFALAITYGKRAPRVTSPDAADFLHVHPRFMHALEFGTMPPVDLFPILTWVPERWAKWKRTVKEIRHLHESLYDRLLKDIENRLEKGQGTGVFMEQAVEHAAEWGLDNRELVLHLGGVLLEGSDTTSATLQNLVLALISFPEAQKKAREEIDRVIGTERAPTFDDLPNLPYTMAVIQEANRFLPIGPLGLPHEMLNDEVVDGVLFPKDAVVFVNLWHIFHDERYFEKPYEFIPERFLKNPLGVKDGVEDDPARRANMLFGGGRRVCPGMAFANSSLEINLTNFLWGFEWLPVIDPTTGKPKMPSMNDYTTGITAVPRPVKIRIRVRSPAHKEIIDNQFTAVGDVLATCELELNKEDRKFNETYRDRL